MFAALILFLGWLPSVSADPSLLPYTTRTQGYSGWSGAVRGDIRTVGMSGAMVGLADSWAGASSNPAGLAMTLGSSGAQINSNRVYDGELQDFNEALDTRNFGAVANPYPYGLSVGYWSPSSEGQRYLLPGTREEVLANVSVKEFQATASRVIWNDRLSLGISLILGQAVKSLELPSRNQSFVDHSFGFGAAAGAMLQLERRWLIGLSFSLPITFPANPGEVNTPGIGGFFQTVRSPAVLGLGTSWIPSRVFRFGLSLLFVGTTPNSALLSDERRTVGQNTTLQPRFGAEYRLLDFRDLESFLTGGSYYENTRIDGNQSRLHFTGGFEINPWILNFGWGIDRANHYSSYIFSAGIDVIRLMRKLDVIPREKRPAYAGFAPNIRTNSEAGLPRPLSRHWDGLADTPSDIIRIGKGIPDKLSALPGKIKNIVLPSSQHQNSIDETVAEEEAVQILVPNPNEIPVPKGSRFNPSSVPSEQSGP